MSLLCSCLPKKTDQAWASLTDAQGFVIRLIRRLLIYAPVKNVNGLVAAAPWSSPTGLVIKLLALFLLLSCPNEYEPISLR